MFSPKSFNPRAREGRDNRSRSLWGIGSVSTHAPARGVTYSVLIARTAAVVSTHAPARGATPTCTRGPGRPRGFNPRAREGRDCSAQA